MSSFLDLFNKIKNYFYYNNLYKQVSGQLKNRNWYQGTIENVNKDGTYDIIYQDGKLEKGVNVDPANIRTIQENSHKNTPRNFLKSGDRVEIRSIAAVPYHLQIVKRHDEEKYLTELEKKKKRDRYYHLEEKDFKGELTKQEITQKNELKQYINKMNQINENFLHEYKFKSMTNNEKEKKYKEESGNRELWEIEKKKKKLPEFINTNFLAMYQREKGKNNIRRTNPPPMTNNLKSSVKSENRSRKLDNIKISFPNNTENSKKEKYVIVNQNNTENSKKEKYVIVNQNNTEDPKNSLQKNEKKQKGRERRNLLANVSKITGDYKIGEERIPNIIEKDEIPVIVYTKGKKDNLINQKFFTIHKNKNFFDLKQMILDRIQVTNNNIEKIKLQIVKRDKENNITYVTRKNETKVLMSTLYNHYKLSDNILYVVYTVVQ